ncbi:AraC family transcriptional regulator [Spirochaetia bacterium]|nr:AraC family transcriptional regulator [Spirochaetia bacterium]
MPKNLEFNYDRSIRVFTTPDRHEIISHGTPNFHMSVHYTRKLPGSSEALYTHWHDELELLFLSAGKACFHVGKEDFLVKAGDILVVQPDVLHSASRVENSGFEFYAVMVHFNFLSSMDNDDIQRKYVLPIFFKQMPYPVHITAEMDTDHTLAKILEAIVNVYYMQEANYELLVKAKFYEAFYHLARYTALYSLDDSAMEYNNQSAAWVRAFLQFINENYHRPIALSDMAQAVCMSEGHFCRTVKRAFGVTPVEFLNNYRVNQAVRLIETTNRNLGDISDMVGFRNVNRFTATFKEVFHSTPLKYRKRVWTESAVPPDTNTMTGVSK